MLLAAGGGGYYYWSSTQKNATVSTEDPSIKKVDNDTLTAEINTLINNKEYDKAQKLIEFQDGSSSDPSKIVLLANVDAEKGDAEAALKTLSAAGANNAEYAYYFKGHEARIVAGTGDTKAAISKYQEAIDLAGKTEAANDTEAFLIARRTTDYQWEIDQLEGVQ